MFRRRVIYLLFAFLLLSQYAGMAHVVRHLASDLASSQSQTSDSTDSKHLPGDLQCAQCLSFTALGSTLPSAAPLIFTALWTARATEGIRTTGFLPVPVRSFDSRGPPFLL